MRFSDLTKGTKIQFTKDPNNCFYSTNRSFSLDSDFINGRTFVIDRIINNLVFLTDESRISFWVTEDQEIFIKPLFTHKLDHAELLKDLENFMATGCEGTVSILKLVRNITSWDLKTAKEWASRYGYTTN